MGNRVYIKEEGTTSLQDTRFYGALFIRHKRIMCPFGLLFCFLVFILHWACNDF